MMANKLINIQLNEISLVDRGANPDAHIILMKSDSNSNKLDKGDHSSFDDILGDQEVNHKLMNMMDALFTSIYAIQRDESITNKAAAFRDSAAQFETAVSELAKEKDMSEHDEDIAKKCKTLVASMAKLEDESKVKDETIVKLEADAKTKDEAVTKLETEMTKLKADMKKLDKSSDNDDEGFDKSKLPKEVRKLLDDQEALNKSNSKKIQDMEDTHLKQDWVGKCDTKDSADLMYKVAKLSPELADEVHKLINAAEKLAKEAGLLKELGDHGNEDDKTALAEINKLADVIVASDGVSHSTAVTRVVKAHPELYKKYRGELDS